MSNAKLIPFTAALALAITFIFGCTSDIDMPPNPGSTPKTDCIREGLGISANTLERIAKECGASWSEVLEQLPSSVGSCKTKDLYFDKPIKDIKSECGVEEMPIISSSSSSNGGGTFTGKGGTFKDSRDNKTYRWVQIGEQVWMAENLNYAVGGRCYGEGGVVVVGLPAEGKPINTITLSNSEIQANCNKYGRLYDWATAMALHSSCNSKSCFSQINTPHRGICPSGWHIPSDGEWTTLSNFVGWSTAGTKLKARSGWNENGNGTDNYGFAALPSGIGIDWGFLSAGYWGCWQSATEDDEYSDDHVFDRGMLYNDERLYWCSGNGKVKLSSVRCVQDYVGGGSSSSAVGSSSSKGSSSSNGKSSSSSLAPSSSSSALPSSSSTQSGIVYGEPVPYQGETYQTVVIGTQTWMARNLNYDVPGNDTDVCYGNNPDNCNTKKYGRLYNWITAMDLPSKCNNTFSTDDAECTIYAKHRGICPNGWHIPSDDDWNILMKFADKSCSDNSNCAGAGTKLKATSGWNEYSGIPTGTDNYGFAALPGGYGLPGGGTYNIGISSYLWSTSEQNDGYTYRLLIGHDYEYAEWGSSPKRDLHSIRCLKDY